MPGFSCDFPYGVWLALSSAISDSRLKPGSLLITLLLALVGLFALVACAPPPRPVVRTVYLEDPPPSFPVAPGVAGSHDIALFLAGRPVGRGAVLSRLQQTEEYQIHQREIGALWCQSGRGRVSRMRQWANSELSPAVGGARVVFYPFGGPDLLHVNALFPQVRNYALMGLEPVGAVPALEALPPEEVLGALAGFRQAVRTQLITGYFITKDMRTDLDRSVLRGVTPVLLCTVALLDGQVESVAPISAGGKPGVEMRFLSADGAGHTAMYVAGDLSNGSFAGGYPNWLAGLGEGVTYFKAASYLIHDNRFSQAREFFLTRSRAILQDDSGIPFRYLAGPEWSLRFYGSYEQPIELFAKHAQSDLR